MTKIEQMALANDLKKLVKHFNPQYVSIFKLPTRTGYIYSLKITMNVPTYVLSKYSSTPRFVKSISFYMDILPGYPATKPVVYYGNEQWLYHVNVFASEGHKQCTDVYDPENSSLVELAEKTARAIVFDPAVTRFNSKASSLPEEWQKQKLSKRELPTMNPALLFARNMKRIPGRV